MHRFARIGVFISGAAVAFAMALAAPVGAGATSPVPAPHGSYNVHTDMNGGVVSFTMSVAPGSCNAIGCVGTWKPNVGTFIGTYAWHASDGSVTFLHGQDHFYGRMTSTGMNSVTHRGRLVVICPKLGTTYGSWYAVHISPA